MDELQILKMYETPEQYVSAKTCTELHIQLKNFKH